MSEYIIGNDGDESILDIGEFELRFHERERIVRCRDCRYLDTPDWDEVLAAQYGEPPASCMRPDGDGYYMRFDVEPDGFCKWGERK